jgi:predicted RNA polymerase sigma factor
MESNGLARARHQSRLRHQTHVILLSYQDFQLASLITSGLASADKSHTFQELGVAGSFSIRKYNTRYSAPVH